MDPDVHHRPRYASEDVVTVVYSDNQRVRVVLTVDNAGGNRLSAINKVPRIGVFPAARQSIRR